MSSRPLSVILSLCFIALFFVPDPANACPEGQSKGAFGWCYPNIGGTVGQTFEAAKKGDLNTVAKGLGDIAITGACPICAVAGQALLQKNDRELISTVVGRGLLLSGVGAPPVLVLYDAAATTATAIELRGQKPPAIPLPQPASRGTKNHKVLTMAACIVQNPDNNVVIGFVSAPSAVEASSGKSATFPEIDLLKDDLVHITANPCPESAAVPGQTVLTDVTIKYVDNQVVTGPSEQMKYFLMGKKA